MMWGVFIILLVCALEVAYGKRVASNRVPLGKFRISGVTKSKMKSPLSGPSTFDLELVEQRKAIMKKKVIEADEKLQKVKSRRAARHNRKMRQNDIAEKILKRSSGVNVQDVDKNEGVEEDNQHDAPIYSQVNEIGSALRRVAAADSGISSRRVRMRRTGLLSSIAKRKKRVSRNDDQEEHWDRT